MSSLSPSLSARCHRSLLNCSIPSLRAAFDTTGLKEYQSKFPISTNIVDTISEIIHMLLAGKSDQRHFLIFMEYERDLIGRENALHQEFSACCDLIEFEYISSKVKGFFEERGNVAQKHIVGNDIESVVKLVQHFLQYPGNTKDRLQREEALNRIWQREASPNMGNAEQLDTITHIIDDICSAYSGGRDTSKVEQLAYRLYKAEQRSSQGEGESEEWRKLDTFLRSLSEGCVTYTRFQQLNHILTDIDLPTDFLRQAYNASMPGGSKTPDYTLPAKDLLFSMLDILRARRHSNGIFPLMDFVWRIKNYIKEQDHPDVCNKLENWYNERRAESGWEEQDMEDRLHEKAHTDAPAKAAYLLISIQAENENTFVQPGEEERVTIKAWLTDYKNTLVEKTESRFSDPVVLMLKDVPAYIDTICQEFGSYLSNDLTIEIFLSTNLLGYAVDHWEIDTGSGRVKVKIGVEHKLVVRFLESIEKPRVKNKLKAQWNRFQEFRQRAWVAEHSDRYEAKGPIWICSEQVCSEGDAFYQALRASDIFCVVLEFAPETTHAFEVLLSAGIPIALWRRQQTDAFDCSFSDLLDVLLYENNAPSPEKLHNLPHLVWEQRRKAQKSLPIYHLTLLWDNPERSLPVSLLEYAQGGR